MMVISYAVLFTLVRADGIEYHGRSGLNCPVSLGFQIRGQHTKLQHLGLLLYFSHRQNKRQDLAGQESTKRKKNITLYVWSRSYNTFLFLSTLNCTPRRQQKDGIEIYPSIMKGIRLKTF